jgi:hypothetical protein
MREGAGSAGLARCRIAAALVDAAWLAGGRPTAGVGAREPVKTL